MRQILVPVDFSNNSYSALFYATQLFKRIPCKFYILNTFEVNTPVFTSRIDTDKGAQLYKKLRANSVDQLKVILHKIKRDTEGLGHHFETVSISKNLLETIQKTVDVQDIDLIVMGTKGATGASKIFMGSNTIKVINTIKECPVMMVPEDFEFENIKNIAFPTDYKRFYLEKELLPIHSISKIFKATIHLIHIRTEEMLNELQEYNLKALKKGLSTLPIKSYQISKLNNKTDSIQNFIEQFDIQLLVMINYKHSFMESITKEPIIKKIGFYPNIPFLVIPDAS